MTQQVDPQANGPDPKAAAAILRFRALIAEVRALRERADRLSVEAEAILADNLLDQAARARLDCLKIARSQPPAPGLAS